MKTANLDKFSFVAISAFFLLLAANACGGGSSTESALDCLVSADCADSQYCRYPLGSCGSQGVCAVRPEVCTEEFSPVCACNGQQFSNSCAAASAGQSVEVAAACK